MRGDQRRPHVRREPTHDELCVAWMDRQLTEARVSGCPLLCCWSTAVSCATELLVRVTQHRQWWSRLGGFESVTQEVIWVTGPFLSFVHSQPLLLSFILSSLRRSPPSTSILSSPFAMAAVSQSAKRAKVALEPHSELPVMSLESNGSEVRQA